MYKNLGLDICYSQIEHIHIISNGTCLYNFK